MLKKVVVFFVGKFSNKMLIGIENLLKNSGHSSAVEIIRLQKFVEKTDFCSYKNNEMPICRISEGAWDYPLFHMYFIRNMLSNIVYCLSKGWNPVVEVSHDGINLWEQFLQQPYQNKGVKKDNTMKVVECDVKEALLEWPLYPQKNDITKFSKLFKNFVILNEDTQRYFDREYENILESGRKRVLGVLCRGTDYTANKPSGHPIQPEIRDVIQLVKAKKEELKCKEIYLATDEMKILEEFEKEFPGEILVNKRHYFDEFYNLRQLNGENARISQVHFDRERDSYYKSLEYFSSVMLLAKCTALIAGNCGGSRAALYLNDNQYEYSYLFDLGIYK